MSIIDNYNRILKEVQDVSLKAGHKAELLAISKSQALEKMDELALNGIKTFGESRLQEAIPKIRYLSDKYSNLEFHFIGKLQRNKLKKIIEYFYLIHSVDKIEIMDIINKYAYELNKIQNILIQIKIAHEEQKNGINPVFLDDIIKEAKKYKNISLKGLMFMPPYEEDVTKNIKYFQIAESLFNKYKDDTFNTLSMGMSHDFKEAILYGATLVRVGSSIFGSRA